jgi:hypothetical protein
VAIELQDIADAVQDLAAHTPAARFEPAERAVVNLGQLGDLLLSQPALVSEAGQQAP